MVRAQATPAAHDPSQPWDWTPPPIPEPLPKPGGPITKVVGAAPTAAPASNAESPSAQGSPAAEASPGVISNVNPGSPPQPAASPAPSPVAEQPAAATVTLTPDFKFDPNQVTIRRGEAVKWINRGRAPQTVTADSSRAIDKSHAALPDGAQPFDSGVLNAGASFSHAFDVAGTYAYFSMPQEQAGMLGTVIVQ